MNNSIDQVSRQYTYAVQPVQLFETRKNQTTKSSEFNFISQYNSPKYNLLHPSVANSTKGSKLDLMG